MSETPDAELMARTARGDERAFAELVVRYQDVLLNGEADDVSVPSRGAGRH